MAWLAAVIAASTRTGAGQTYGRAIGLNVTHPLAMITLLRCACGRMETLASAEVMRITVRGIGGLPYIRSYVDAGIRSTHDLYFGISVAHMRASLSRDIDFLPGCLPAQSFSARGSTGSAGMRFPRERTHSCNRAAQQRYKPLQVRGM